MKEKYIIQNIWAGPQHINDLGITLGPLDTYDLTGKDSDIVSSSRDLKNALRSGLLRRITEQESDEIDRRSLEKAREETLRQVAEKSSRLNYDSEDLEPVMMTQQDAQNIAQDINAGSTNDPMSFAIALEIAQNQAKERGYYLSVEEFHDSVKKNPNYVSDLIENNTMKSTSVGSTYSNYNVQSQFRQPQTRTVAQPKAGGYRQSASHPYEVTIEENQFDGSESIDLESDLGLPDDAIDLRNLATAPKTRKSPSKAK